MTIKVISQMEINQIYIRDWGWKRWVMIRITVNIQHKTPPIKNSGPVKIVTNLPNCFRGIDSHIYGNSHMYKTHQLWINIGTLVNPPCDQDITLIFLDAWCMHSSPWTNRSTLSTLTKLKSWKWLYIAII